MTIVVTDAAGVPVVLRRLTGASARSCDIAIRNAATVAASRLATAEYGAQLKSGGVKEVANGITFAGGVPIMRGSELIWHGRYERRTGDSGRADLESRRERDQVTRSRHPDTG